MDRRQAIRLGLIAASLFVIAACEDAAPYGPLAVVVHPAGTHLYVAGGTLTESVWIVDAGTHQVVGTIPVPFPRILAISPAGRLYALNGRDATVAVIDTARHTIVDELRIEDVAIDGIGVNGTGTGLYVAAEESVRVYDTSNHKLIGSIPEEGYGFVSAPWLDEVYVLKAGSPTTISVLHGASAIGEIQIPVDLVAAVAIHPSGTQLYVADFSTARILLVDPARRTVASVVHLPHIAWSIAVHPAGRVLYVVSSEATVESVALPAGRILASRSVGQRPGEIAIHPSGTHLYVTDQGEHAVHVLEASTLNIIATVRP